MKKKEEKLVVYQTKTGSIQLRGDGGKETIWASLDQIARIFGRDKSVISRHIKNIFKDRELERKSVVAFFATTAADGKTYQVEYFNLDIILSVGYRVNSQQAIKFRQWATKILREYIVDGFVVNKKRIADNYRQFQEAVAKVKELLPAGAVVETADILELVNMFADTWFSLTAYDKDALKQKGPTKRRVVLTADKLENDLAELKKNLISKKQATGIFAQPRDKGVLEGIIGNVMQSFGGKELYASVEEKAAHLLYFMVKNHPFVDGNKRSGAYAFVWYLRQARILDTSRITPPALTALTILVAESRPKDKDKMVGLIITLLLGGK
ncbi:virulence RhuM family protein [Patescibacteria group bacterium]|nr:virulence RhuM family protein [Patescibacteria group bacterium]MBU1705412.1 virulence RhuM family protein [Patescibacteria group bacterium]